MPTLNDRFVGQISTNYFRSQSPFAGDRTALFDFALEAVEIRYVAAKSGPGGEGGGTKYHE